MDPRQSPSPLCATCGGSLASTGECFLCLVHLAFDESSDQEPPLSFGDYEIAHRDDGSPWELGRGAMGVTYCARDKVLHRSVALKVVNVPAADRSGQPIRDRFLREARAAAAFRHPNVAGVFQFGTTAAGDRCYYAMELVEGETLEALVRRDGPLRAEEALEIVVQVTRALIAAATHGLIHRDLKPGNIMLTHQDAEAGGLVVKIIDFGLAKAVTEQGSGMDLTQGAFLGTPAFASPEQFSGAPADARSDIYSLGVTLWYALTGEVPYGGKTIEEIRHGQTELALPVEKLTTRRLPRPLVHLLRRVLAVDPAARPASARELMQDVEACRVRLGQTRPHGLKRRSVQGAVLTVVGLIALGTAGFFAFRHSRYFTPPSSLAPPKSIAVLPFQNLSKDEKNAYFAGGVQDEILTALSKVADLRVISRNSVMQFREVEKRNLSDIAGQLGVAHLLTGTVQRTENHIRITVELTDARDASLTWSQHYDGELADIFAIQSEIAQKTATQLEAVISPNEQASLVEKPTQDTAAYESYLRAKEIHRDGGAGGVMGNNALKEIALLSDAVSRDAAFVPALCLLTQAHLDVYWFGQDHSPARLELAKKALEGAARLQPDSGDVHLARALFHFRASRAYASALTELALAASVLPNDAGILYQIASIQRRQGRWEESIKTMGRARVLDPRNGTFTLGLSHTYRRLRRYDEARRVVENALTWKVGDLGFQFVLAEIDVQEKADLTRMREILSRNQFTAADHNLIVIYRHMLAYLEKDYPAAEKALLEYGPWEMSHGVNTPREYLEGVLARELGQIDRATAAFARARELAFAAVTARADDAKALMVLAKIDAKLGRKEEAVREAERAIEQLPVSMDAFDGPALLSLLVQIYAEVGETDQAIEVLQQAAALPGGPSYGFLQLDQDYDPLRNDPRFQKIVARLAPPQKR